MGDGISKAITAGVTALSLGIVLATAEPVAAQQQGGGWGRPGATSREAPWDPPVPSGSIAPPSFGDPFWSDCWQVRPIYSLSGAWLDNRRVNVCY